MKYKVPPYALQVGDKIEVSIGSAYRRVDVVTRVTKTMAICENNGVVRYPRTLGFSFYALPYKRSNLQYCVIDQETI
jgi:hypothetical protein